MRKITYRPLKLPRLRSAISITALFLSFACIANASRSVTLEWDPSPESDVSGYRLKYGTAKGAYDQSLDVAKVTSASIASLADDREYYFVVVAYNTAGLVSEHSNEVTLPVAASPLPTYDNWSTQLPVGDRAPTADPDQDGISNLLEYALGRSPSTPESTPLLDLQVNGSSLTLRFTYPSNRQGIQLVLQESTDLIKWKTVTDTTDATGSDPETQVRTLKRNVTNTPQIYFRLVVTDQKGSAMVPPVGVMRPTIAGTTRSTGSVATSMFGLGLMRPAAYRGSAGTVGKDVLSDALAWWKDGQFDGADGPYVLEITSGPAIGTTYDIVSTSAQGKSIRVAQPFAPGAASGLTFEIRKHWTLASIFGPANEASLMAGTEATADRILLWNGTSNDQYYYQTNSSGGGWRKVGNQTLNQANVVIYPEDGVTVQRRQSGARTTYLAGAVKTWKTSIPVLPGTNVLGNVYAAPMTLASSGLYTGQTSTGLSSGTQNNADQVLLWNGTKYDSYFYKSNAGWRKIGSNSNASGTVIPAGAAVTILRKGSTGFNWVVPTHPAGL